MATSIIGGEAIYSSLAGDPCMGELVEMYIEETPARIKTLEQAFASGDREALRTVAHQMRGAAGSYGFETLTVSAGILETAIRAGESPDAIQRAFQELIAAYRRVRAGIRPNA
jgi:HPt (histidine-containing phosphotransfer) domain-containing protein